MRRYWMFWGIIDEANGGIDDLWQEFDTKKAAIAGTEKFLRLNCDEDDESENQYYFWYILDTETDTVFFQHNYKWLTDRFSLDNTHCFREVNGRRKYT